MQIATVSLPGFAVYAATLFDALKTGSASIGSVTAKFANGIMPICSETKDHVTFAWSSGIGVDAGAYSLDVKSVTAYSDRLSVACDLSGVVAPKSTMPAQDVLDLRSAASIASLIFNAVKSKRVQLSPQASLLFVREVVPTVKAAGDCFELRWASGAYIEIAGIPDPFVSCIRVYRDHWEVLLPLRTYVEVSFK